MQLIGKYTGELSVDDYVSRHSRSCCTILFFAPTLHNMWCVVLLFLDSIRHPVNRVVSAYYYCRQHKHSWDPLCASSVMSSTEASLVDFAEHWGNYGLRQFAMSLVPASDVLRYVDEIIGENQPATLDGAPVDDIPSWFLLKSYLRHLGHNGEQELNCTTALLLLRLVH